jgi:hypothetical protein
MIDPKLFKSEIDESEALADEVVRFAREKLDFSKNDHISALISGLLETEIGASQITSSIFNDHFGNDYESNDPREVAYIMMMPLIRRFEKAIKNRPDSEGGFGEIKELQKTISLACVAFLFAVTQGRKNLGFMGMDLIYSGAMQMIENSFPNSMDNDIPYYEIGSAADFKKGAK